MQIDPLEVAVVIAASVVLTLLFDTPMQEVKSVIMESTDALALEASDDKKTSVREQDEAADVTGERAEDDEIAPADWDWRKDVAKANLEETVDAPTMKKMNGKRMPLVDRETRDSDEASSSRSSRGKVASKKPSRDMDDYDNHKRAVRLQRYVTDDSDEETVEFLKSQREYEVVQRNRRSSSRTKDNNKRRASGESESEDERQRKRESEDESRQFRRSESRGRAAREVDDYRSWEFVGKEVPLARDQQQEPRQSKAPLARSADVARKILSSESEEEPAGRRAPKPERVSSSDTRTSDEEEWERELRIRRKQFMEKLVSQQPRELLGEEETETIDAQEPLKRRSSAEGRIALLKDDVSGEDNMDSWTVSVGPRIALLGSSQEPSETEDDGIYMRQREYREQGPPSREESQSEEESSQDTSRRQSYTSGSQKTSLEEEDDANSNNFVLTKGSKRESLQDLSRLSQEELADSGWNVVEKEAAADLSVKPSTGLFKRESIVKSQASEEDPEYLLPERPKLVQQEREHPFKKAWQMQKSRSEEDGSAAYAIKDPKGQQAEAKSKGKEPPVKRDHSSEQSEDIEESFADDEVEVSVVLRSRSTDTEDNRTGTSRSGTDDSASTDYSRVARNGDYRQSSKSETDEDSAKFNWPDEEEEEEEKPEGEAPRVDRRRKSEEADWDWEQEET